MYGLRDSARSSEAECLIAPSQKPRLNKFATWCFGGLFLGATILLHHNNTNKPVADINMITRKGLNSTSISGDSSSYAYPGEPDEVIDLPLLPSDYTGERHYSGYLALGKTKMLHYWFVESQQDPQNDPVVLWLNGGPGASSMNGWLYENGPFLMNDDGSLSRNPYSWNRKANMLYFESPVGVGFSYDTSGKYINGDHIQAKDNVEALVKFFEKFPHFQKNDFIITGESYGGVYVPTTAKETVLWNSQNADKKINIKAFAVGNGLNEYQTNSMMYFAYYHGLMGKDEWEALHGICPSLKEYQVGESYFNRTSGQCAVARLQAFGSLLMAHINSYDIYRKCAYGNPFHGAAKLLQELAQNPENIHSTIHHPLGFPVSLCLNNTAGELYLNRKDVKKALHVPEDLEWSGLAITNLSVRAITSVMNTTFEGTILNYGTPLEAQVTPLWNFLLKNNVRGVIYHGDVDLMCDFLGGQWAVESLKLPVVQPYSPWHVKNENGDFQVGGYIKRFKGMSFITVEGAGHMVPQWKPVESLHMFENYILRSEEIDV